MEIKIARTKKMIRVNNDGDFITVDTGDQAFISGLVSLVQDFECKRQAWAEKVSQIEAMPGTTQAEQIEKAREAAEFNMEVCGDMKKKVDELFNDDVCHKLFGDIVPGVGAFAEFFVQLNAIVSSAQAEQNERVRQYTEKYTVQEA